ncbi:MAG: hypothetical protein ACSLE6_16160 [Mycobacterium sp.]
MIGPTSRHADVLAGLVAKKGAAGNLVNDAHLVALALEHRGDIVSYDSDSAASRVSGSQHPSLFWRELIELG